MYACIHDVCMHVAYVICMYVCLCMCVHVCACVCVELRSFECLISFDNTAYYRGRLARRNPYLEYKMRDMLFFQNALTFHRSSASVVDKQIRYLTPEWHPGNSFMETAAKVFQIGFRCVLVWLRPLVPW